MTCPRCHLPPSSPVRELGDPAWPNTIEGFCLECVREIVREWRAGKGERDALQAHLVDVIAMRDKCWEMLAKPQVTIEHAGDYFGPEELPE